MNRRRFIRLAGGGVTAMSFAAFGQGKEQVTENKKDKIPAWLDTDIGADVDDAVCLFCAIRHPQVELLGVSTVRGCIGSVQAAAWVVREMLRRARSAHISVLPGSLRSLSGGGPSPNHFGTYGTLAPKLDPLPTAPKDDDSRIDAIADAMRAVGGPFHLLTVGPMTNAARIAVRHPEVAKKWRTVTCMAGRLKGDAECNARLDVEATRLCARG